MLFLFFLLWVRWILVDVECDIQQISNKLYLQMIILRRFHYFSDHQHLFFKLFDSFLQLWVASFFLHWRHFLFLSLLLYLFRSVYFSWWLGNCAGRCGCHLLWSSWNWVHSLFRWRRLFFRYDLSSSVVSLWNYIFLSKSKIRIVSTSSLFSQIIVASITTVKVVISF